jgi:low temperature requirement protein LtrA
MTGRDPDQEHRASTPLELLFDLCFVVAVAQAAAQLHSDLISAHAAAGVGGYLMVFFAIWWAWINFTWFASAYDTDDVPYRLLTLLQIAGVLVLAAGVSAAAEGDFSTVTWGYVIMRVAMVAQWLRAARGSTDATSAGPRQTTSAYRYAAGVTAVQALWLLRLVLPHSWGTVLFAVFVLLELAVPVWAEYRTPLPWHPGHITERYGLFTLIVLGECVAAATVAIRAAVGEHGLSAGLLVLAGGALLLVFALWWSYFKHENTRLSASSMNVTLLWGYGHYLIFAALAALGAGLEVAADAVEHAEHATEALAGWAVAVPVAVFVLTGSTVQRQTGAVEYLPWPATALAAAAVVAVGALTPALGVPAGVLAVALVVTALLVANLVAAERHPAT